MEGVQLKCEMKRGGGREGKRGKKRRERSSEADSVEGSGGVAERVKKQV